MQALDSPPGHMISDFLPQYGDVYASMNKADELDDADSPTAAIILQPPPSPYISNMSLSTHVSAYM